MPNNSDIYKSFTVNRALLMNILKERNYKISLRFLQKN